MKLHFSILMSGAYEISMPHKDGNQRELHNQYSSKSSIIIELPNSYHTGKQLLST